MFLVMQFAWDHIWYTVDYLNLIHLDTWIVRVGLDENKKGQKKHLDIWIFLW